MINIDEINIDEIIFLGRNKKNEYIYYKYKDHVLSIILNSDGLFRLSFNRMDNSKILRFGSFIIEIYDPHKYENTVKKIYDLYISDLNKEIFVEQKDITNKFNKLIRQNKIKDLLNG